MNYMDEMNKMWAEMTAEDEAAKANNTLVGRFVQFPFADGYAFYKVKAIKKKIVTLDHIPFGDAWMLPLIDSMGRKLPLDAVNENIHQRD